MIGVTAPRARSPNWPLDSRQRPLRPNSSHTAMGSRSDAFEFAAETPFGDPAGIVCGRWRTALKRRYRQLSRAAVVVHPHHFGRAPRKIRHERRATRRGQGLTARALRYVMQRVGETGLGERLRTVKSHEDLSLDETSVARFRGELLNLSIGRGDSTLL